VTYKEALAWLYSLQRFGIKLGLENITRLIHGLNVDLPGARVIHVAGTNGKGSVCAMIDSICRASNYRTGLFTSPHLVTFRERICVNGEMISESEVAKGLTGLRDFVREWEPHPTFFEITTALALKHFAKARVQVAVLETGLGGRLDATNAVCSDVAVITPIAMDHEKWLGDSLEKIASEKAGIIKPNDQIICAAQSPTAEKVIRARAADCGAPLHFITTPYRETPVGLRGEHQKLNAALAIAAIRAAKIDPETSAVARGLATVDWPARFQCWDKCTVIDGAHNPAAARILVETWQEVFGDAQATLILAILSDKDARAICETFAPIAGSIWLPQIRTERAADPVQLQKVFADLGKEARTSPSFAEALAKARAEKAPILITGSLHFTGEALAHLQGKPAAFEECAQ